MIKNIKFIDSHVHLDIIYKHKPGGIGWLRETGCLPVSWAYSMEVRSINDLKIYLNEQRRTINELNTVGVPCLFLAGVHPRNITADLKPGDIRSLILRSLDDPLCLGVGEIGLETGSEREKEILAAHIDLAEDVISRGKKFGVHTPRDDKARVTGEILQILKRYEKYSAHIVVDHCTEETVGAVLGAGFWAGVSISPMKISAEEVERIIINNPGHTHRIMLNTDSGGKFFEDIFNFRRNTGKSKDIMENITLKNAAEFFGI
ncbi:MAG: TatD family hydrolase [Spirochaetes bacterium]|jgi:hypothetical protein|nr:TatD family hydrolase [Spirochaetota bacterium]